MAELRIHLSYQFPDPVFSWPLTPRCAALTICTISKEVNSLLHSVDSPLIRTVEAEKEGSSMEAIAFGKTSVHYET